MAINDILSKLAFYERFQRQAETPAFPPQPQRPFSSHIQTFTSTASADDYEALRRLMQLQRPAAGLAFAQPERRTKSRQAHSPVAWEKQKAYHTAAQAAGNLTRPELAEV